jgi:uncharacterized protein YPO0396
MPNREFDFSSDGEAPGGWRLDRLEMANWGTFGEGLIHVLTPVCGWSLLVGENASGKSTAVDALRTLLAPRAVLQHSFNDAAGGQKKKDRSLVTYIRGKWSASRDEESADAVPQFLRKEETPSYLLAVFRNERRKATLTLAQILWVTNGKDETIYLVAGGEKSIAENLVGLTAGRGLAKELAARGFDERKSYKAYREDLCARMGIPGEGALEIFNQAIGVKEVSDVSIFLRRHLLAPSLVEQFIHERVVPQFQNLESCWNDIGRSKAQIALLGPVAEAHAQVTELEEKRTAVRTLIDALPGYYLRRHAILLREYVDHCVSELATARADLADLERRRGEAQQLRDSLKAQFDADETSRAIERIDLQMAAISQRAKEREEKSTQLANLLRAEAIEPMPTDDTTFAEMRRRITERCVQLDRDQQQESDKAHAAGVERKSVEEELKTIGEDLKALRDRQVLIPAVLQRVRDELSEATGVPAADLPFAGELIEVKPEYAEEWSGAIEKLLKNFGISLLVPERHYQRVVRWINERRLKDAEGRGLRLDYHAANPGAVTAQTTAPDARSVGARLNFRTEHVFARWVEAETRRSFPHVCCRDTVELERERFGLTREGTIRNGTRHTKDDRRPLGSRRDYVLGWSPEKKIQALEMQWEDDTARLAALGQSEATARTTAAKLGQRTQALDLVSALNSFSDIDFTAEQAQLAQLANDRAELEKSSERRRELEKQLKAAEKSLSDLGTERDGIVSRRDRWMLERDNERPLLDTLDTKVAKAPSLDFDALTPAFLEAEGGDDVSYRNVGEIRERVDKTLRGRASNLTAKINEAAQQMIGPMKEFLITYPEEASDLAAEPAYAPDFVKLHEQLVREDLPKHEERFRDFLNTNLTENIGGLEDKLNTEVKAHRARIVQVNTALAGLEYSPGVYVELDERPTRDAAIRDFKARLRDCLSAGLHPDENQRLELYKKIREIVTRFGKEPDWTAHVNDSRLWLDFGVRERRRADGVEINYLDSSTGKSGGQKAKLAFTILSASLLAQYGLADDPHREDSLRLVVVDEVFARTDEPNSRRALELFRRMGFQLLLAAPWKAEARIAENYVDSFHLTVNPNGDASRVKRASRTEYEAQRDSAHG